MCDFNRREPEDGVGGAVHGGNMPMGREQELQQQRKWLMAFVGVISVCMLAGTTMLVQITSGSWKNMEIFIQWQTLDVLQRAITRLLIVMCLTMVVVVCSTPTYIQEVYTGPRMSVCGPGLWWAGSAWLTTLMGLATTAMTAYFAGLDFKRLFPLICWTALFAALCFCSHLMYIYNYNVARVITSQPKTKRAMKKWLEIQAAHAVLSEADSLSTISRHTRPGNEPAPTVPVPTPRPGDEPPPTLQALFAHAPSSATHAPSLKKLSRDACPATIRDTDIPSDGGRGRGLLDRVRDEYRSHMNINTPTGDDSATTGDRSTPTGDHSAPTGDKQRGEIDMSGSDTAYVGKQSDEENVLHGENHSGEKHGELGSTQWTYANNVVEDSYTFSNKTVAQNERNGHNSHPAWRSYMLDNRYSAHDTNMAPTHIYHSPSLHIGPSKHETRARTHRMAHNVHNMVHSAPHLCMPHAPRDAVPHLSMPHAPGDAVPWYSIPGDAAPWHSGMVHQSYQHLSNVSLSPGAPHVYQGARGVPTTLGHPMAARPRGHTRRD